MPIQGASMEGIPRPLRLLMCVTGQSGRLEVSSKLENFVKYNNAKGHVVDVVTVLDNREDPRFVNKANAEKIMNSSASRFRRYASQFREIDFAQPENPEVPSWYAKILKKGKPDLDSRKRVQSHIRQFATIERCYQEMMDLELKNNHKYDEILRVRDDAFLLKGINPLHETKSYPDILVNHCDNWYGLNDKAALMLRPTAEIYFTGFLRTLFLDSGEIEVQKAIRNPETLTKVILEKGNVTVHQDGERLPVAPIRGQELDGCLHMLYTKCWKDLMAKIDYQLTEQHPRCPGDRTPWPNAVTGEYPPDAVKQDRLE